MSVGQVVLLPGLGGKGWVEVREGGQEDRVVVTRADKVVLYSTGEREVEHSWYVGAGEGEVSAGVVRGEEVVVGRGSKVVLAGRGSSKLEECKEVEVGGQVHEVLEHQGELLVVFRHGGIQSLKVLEQQAEEGEKAEVKGVLGEGEKVVQVRLVQEGSSTRVGLVGEGREGELVLVTGSLVLEGEGRALVVGEREEVGSKEGREGIHLSHSLALLCLHSGEGGSCLQEWRGGGWEEVLPLSSPLHHCALASLGEGHLAVMGSLQEGGVLHLVNTQFR